MSRDEITVTGVAGRDVAPDAVSWRAEAVEVDDDPRAAFERCSARLNALTETLAAVGDVSTEAVSVRPEWDEHDDRRTGRIEAVGGVRMRAQPGRAGALARAAMAAGADWLDGPRFLYDSADAVRVELLADALADARRKADRLAQACGRRVARVHTVVEDEGHVGVGRFAAASAEPDVRPRTETISATLRVTFALADS